MIGRRRIKLWVSLETCVLGIVSLAPQVASPSPSQQPGQNLAPSNATMVTLPTRSELVWVNTTSGYYHKSRSRHYGKTKHGKYMQEPDAVRAGYRPARN